MAYPNPTLYNVAPAAGFNAGTNLAALAPTIVAGKQIDMKDPGLTPFMVMTHQTQKMPAVNNISYLTHDDSRIPRYSTVTADAASGAQTIAVADGSVFAPWDTVYIYEKEYRAHVVAVSGNNLTVAPNSDSGGASAITSGDVIYNLGKSLTDGTDITNMINTMPSAFTNYIENFQRVVSITRFGEKLINYYKDPHFKRLWDQAVHAFKTDMDLKLLFNGAPRSVSADTLQTASGGTYTRPASNGGLVGLTAGFWWWHRNYASASRKIFQDAMTEFETIDALEVAFDEKGGSDHKVFMCGKSYGSAFLKWNLGRVRFTKMTGDGKEMPLGLKFTRFENGTNGMVDIVRHWAFEPQGANSLHKFAIIDKNRIGYVPYSGMDTFIERDLPTTAQVKIDYIGAAMGGVWHNPDAHVTGEVRTFTV